MKSTAPLIAFFLFLQSIAFGQTSLQGWHLLDANKDSIHGISIDKAYGFLRGKKSVPVVVAVIDSGVDTLHEDLKNILWHNPKEIPNNGIDDDKNGYVDDVYGWNFLGGKDGRSVNKESKEAGRIYHQYKSKFEGKEINEKDLTGTEKEAYKLWKQAEGLLKLKPTDKQELMLVEMAYKGAKKYEAALMQDMKKDTFTMDMVEQYTPSTSTGERAKMGYLSLMKLLQMDAGETNVSSLSQLNEYMQQKQELVDAKDKIPESHRAEIVKDNYADFNDRFYGNNDVMGPAPLHGTHVSGIIAAQRNNGVGIDGVADNVKIMMIRAVPDGDEYDKDIALAIRYAVDNGARVINMSFGKGLSPEKKWVDEAVKYAETKDVLLIHAAGNDAENVDSVGNFPSPFLKQLNRNATNFITVGASTDPKVSKGYVADFSNYGKGTVDVFAPGMKIYSTVPGGNTYRFLQGTSMAAPVVAGVAALIRSYYPSLNVKQVRAAIEKSVVCDTTVQVTIPGSLGEGYLKQLCASGGEVNAYTAVKYAAGLLPQKVVANKSKSLPKSSFQKSSIKG